MIGRSPAMQHVYKLIGQVCELRCYGPDSRRVGYRKRACRQRDSLQAAGEARVTLVKVNCAIYPPRTLLESELFGHEKGAFTNAAFRRSVSDALKRRAVGRSSWTKLVNWLRLTPIEAASERSRNGQLSGWGAMRPFPVNIRLLAATSRNPGASR